MTMRTLTRLAVAGACALAATVGTVSAAHAGSGCRYYYTSWGKGPNGQTTGYGDYQEGDRDPEGRVCENGWWVEPYTIDNPDAGLFAPPGGW